MPIVNKAYGINIKHYPLSDFERICTFDNVDIAHAAYRLFSLSQEAQAATCIELEEISELENGDFEYKTLTYSLKDHMPTKESIQP